jgi:hypothetical protein
MRRNKFFAQAIKNAGLDLTKDYFSLSSYEISIVDTIRKSFNYSGRNYLGRSRSRQFWYAAQAGI